MMKTHLRFIAAAATMLVAVPLWAAVHVGTEQPEEKSVAFRTPENKYVSAIPPSALDLSGVKIGSKQTFTLIDVNGGQLVDGDEVKIRYTPHSTPPDPTKFSHWREAKEGIKRSHDGDSFKIKRVETKCVLVAPSGKFVAAPTAAGLLGLSDKQEGALVVELIDSKSGSTISIGSKPGSAEQQPAEPAPPKPATERPVTSTPAAPVPDKPPTP